MPSPRSSSRPLRLVLLILLLPLLTAMLSGCGTFISLIKLRRDGSGTVEQTVAFSGMMSAMLTSMKAAGDSASSTPSGLGQLFEEEKIRARAEKLGEGVRFVSMETIDEGSRQGYTATYAFEDIRTLRLQSESVLPDTAAAPSDTPGQNGSEEKPAEKEKTADFTFDFEPGSPSTLTISAPDIGESLGENTPGPGLRGPKKKTASSDTTNISRKLLGARMMFQDMLIRLAIEPQGTITETNAAYRTDGRITLFEMDFNELLKDEEALRQFLTADRTNASEKELGQMVKTTPGFHFEDKKQVTVRFK